MAADVDKTIPEDKSKISQQTGHQGRSSGSWIYRGIWTLLVVCAVPLLAFGIKYYQDAQLLKRHEESVRTLGAEGLFLFSSLDTDHDLYLSPEEFKPIAEKLT
ncbi:selenoprotein N-like, partial [Plectropomus leopardus]|uniref:selenoprotein N-like n=1 Tax=Plectropomus leopardus TaxID=160734 RepID=UPI001C4C7B1F